MSADKSSFGPGEVCQFFLSHAFFSHITNYTQANRGYLLTNSHDGGNKLQSLYLKKIKRKRHVQNS